MFQLSGGLIRTVYPRSELAKDAGVAFAPAKSGDFGIGHADPPGPGAGEHVPQRFGFADSGAGVAYGLADEPVDPCEGRV